jgi:hypothetical protein
MEVSIGVILETGWQDELVKKTAQNVAQRINDKMYAFLVFFRLCLADTCILIAEQGHQIGRIFAT